MQPKRNQLRKKLDRVVTNRVSPVIKCTSLRDVNRKLLQLRGVVKHVSKPASDYSIRKHGGWLCIHKVYDGYAVIVHNHDCNAPCYSRPLIKI